MSTDIIPKDPLGRKSNPELFFFYFKNNFSDGHK